MEGSRNYFAAGRCWVLAGFGLRYHGNVFEIAANGTFSILYSFTNGADGAGPAADLIMDQAGNLYGTTSDSFSGANGSGTVFKLTP